MLGIRVGDRVKEGAELGSELGCNMMGIPMSTKPHVHLEGLPG
jgi:hypothetical protein